MASDPHSVALALYTLQFYSFVRRAFMALNPGDTFSGEKYVRAMAYVLERVYAGECKRLVIMLPPRHLKSITTSVAFPAWVLGRDPTKRIVCASYSTSLSTSLSIQSRELMQSPFYRETFPKTRLSKLKNASEEFLTTRNGGRIATSVGGTLTGRGGDILIIDDPMKAEDAHSEVMRDNVHEWYKGTLSSRLDDPKNGAIVVVAQRLHSDDLIGRLLEADDWEVLRLPIVSEEEKIYPLNEGLNWKRANNHLLDESRIGLDELERIKRELGTSAFEAQYMLRPGLPGGNLIRKEWFGHYDWAPHPKHYEATLQSWDVAAVPGETNDWCVCTTWGVLGQHVDLLEVHRAQHIMPDLIRAAKSLIAKWQPSLVVVEKATSGIGLGQALRDAGIPGVKPLTPKRGKVERMSLQSPKLERGEVRLPTAAPWLKAFFDEVLAFPNGTHDDQVDTMSQILHALDCRPREISHVGRYKRGR